MPAKSSQKNTFEWFYNLVAKDVVKIRLTSKSDNYISFEVKGSYRRTIKVLALGYFDDNGSLSNIRDNSTIVIATNQGTLGKFESNNEIGSGIFDEARRSAEFTTYNGKKFLDSIVPSLGKFLLSNIKEEVSTTEDVQDSQQVTESATVVSTTKLSDFETINPNYGLANKERRRNRGLFLLHGIRNQDRKNMN